MQKVSFVYWGAPQFSAEILKRLIETDYVPEIVFTYPDKPRGRGRKPKPMPVKVVANNSDLPVMEVSEMGAPKVISTLKDVQPDVGLIISFGILPGEVYTLPKYGVLNLHPSLLPDLRGPTPIQTAVLRGYDHTGITIMSISEEVDSGKILMQEKLEIGENETRGELESRIINRSPSLVIEAFEKVKDGNFVVEQQDDSLATQTHKFNREDYRISWSQEAEKIHNKIRAFSPRPGAYTFYDNKEVKILGSTLTSLEQSNGEPGELLKVEKDLGLVVQTQKGQVVAKKLKPENSRTMHFRDFVNGYRVEEGDYFGKNS